MKQAREMDCKMIHWLPSVQDGAAAIWLHTVEGALYKQLNVTLRDHDRQTLKKFYFPNTHTHILMEARHTLQKKEEVRALHCGVKLGLVTMNPAKDGKEMDLIGWSFTSTTCHVEV